MQSELIPAAKHFITPNYFQAKFQNRWASILDKIFPPALRRDSMQCIDASIIVQIVLWEFGGLGKL